MTGKAANTFPGFQGFPGAVGTLCFVVLFWFFFDHNVLKFLKVKCNPITKRGLTKVELSQDALETPGMIT